MRLSETDRQWIEARRTLDQVLAKLPGARRAKIEARVVEIIAEEKSLQDLRRR